MVPAATGKGPPGEREEAAPPRAFEKRLSWYAFAKRLSSWPRDIPLAAIADLLQGYLAHKKSAPPLGPPYDSRYSPTVGS